MSFIFVPPKYILPDCGSYNFTINLNNVDFPSPLSPKIILSSVGLNIIFKLLNTGLFLLYSNDTSLKTIISLNIELSTSSMRSIDTVVSLKLP